MMNRTLLAVALVAYGVPLMANETTDSVADIVGSLRCPCHAPAKPLPPAPTPPPPPALPEVDLNEPAINLDSLENEELRGWACIRNETGRTITVSTGTKNATQNDVENGKEINLICAPTMVISDGRSTIEYKVEAPALCLKGVYEVTHENGKLTVTKVAEKVETEEKA